MKSILLFAAFSAALCTAPASAEPVQHSQIVGHSDLDLGTDAGVRELDRRIRVAARSVCGTATATDPRSWIQVRQCRKDTITALSGQRARALAAAKLERAVATAH